MLQGKLGMKDLRELLRLDAPGRILSDPAFTGAQSSASHGAEPPDLLFELLPLSLETGEDCCRPVRILFFF
jgi:hypothetical protein